MVSKTTDGFRHALSETNGFLVGAAVGAGMTAQAAQSGGADFLLALTAGRLRMMGAASVAGNLPFHDSNRLVDSFAYGEILSQCRVPVFLGASALDPRTDLNMRASNAAQAGFHGMVNWPTSILYPEDFQAVLEAANNGFRREIEMLSVAESHGMASLAYVATLEQAVYAAHQGIEMLCINFGWSPGGHAGVDHSLTLPEVAIRAREITRAVRKINSAILLFVEGGPLDSAENVGTILRDTPINGYIGGSTLERLPIEDSVSSRTLAFKSTARQLAQEKDRSREMERWALSHGLFGSSDLAIALFVQIRRLATVAQPVLMWGEEGVPAQKLAMALLNQGRPHGESIAVLSARQLTATQIESRLFGNDSRQHSGLLSDPEQPLVLLEDLERIPGRIQARLGRVLRDGWYSPIGTRRRINVTTRLVFVVRQAPELLVTAGQLDIGLAAIVGTNALCIPSLRERHTDIEPLLIHTVQQLRPEISISFAPSGRRALLIEPWAGNDAQLHELARQIIASGKHADITADDIQRLNGPVHSQLPAGNEREQLLKALWQHRYSRQKTADYLGVSRKTLYNRMQRHGLLDQPTPGHDAPKDTDPSLNA